MCPLSSKQTKNKRICKMKRFFHLPLLRSRGRFSSHSGGEVILARRHTVQTLLVSARIVKAYEFFNSGNEFFSARKLFKIVHSDFKMPPGPPSEHCQGICRHAIHFESYLHPRAFDEIPCSYTEILGHYGKLALHSDKDFLLHRTL